MKSYLSIVMPVFNEEKTIEEMMEKTHSVLEKTRKKYEIICVDDGSTDNSNETMHSIRRRMKNTRIVKHGKNKGLGAALKTGIKEAKGELIITIDSDLSHNPKDIVSFLEKIDSDFDMVIGSRYVPGGGMLGVPISRMIISRFTNLVFSVIFGMKIKDISSGYRCFKSKLKKEIISSSSDGFSFQLESVVRCKKSGYRISEIPIILKYRTKGETKFNLIKAIKGYLPVFFKLVTS